MANDNRCNGEVHNKTKQKKKTKKPAEETPKNVREIFMERTEIAAAIFRLLSYEERALCRTKKNKINKISAAKIPKQKFNRNSGSERWAKRGVTLVFDG